MSAIRYVQLLNPATGRYLKIDVKSGRIIDRKSTPGPYAGVPIATALNPMADQFTEDNRNRNCHSCPD